MTEMDIVLESGYVLRTHATNDVTELDPSAHDLIVRCADGLYLGIQILKLEKGAENVEPFIIGSIPVH